MIHSCFTRGLGLQKSSLSLFARSHHNDTIPCTWKKPKIGYIKLNFDGASRTENASIGGVYRDHKGEFLLGYSETIGKATSSVAELVAAKRGVELALQNGWLNIWIEGDARGVVDVLRHRIRIKSEEDQRHARDLSLMIPQLNDFNVSHIYREGNRVADKLAKMGYMMSKPRIWRDDPPQELTQLLLEDAEGKVILRKK